MPSFDIVSRFNFPELDNAINNAKKAIAARFDFRGVQVEFALDPKEKTLKLTTDDEGKLRAVLEMFHQAAVKRGLPLKSFDWGEVEAALAGRSKVQAKILDGLEQDTAKSIVKLIKDSKMKVQASIQGDEVRVSGKQRDDLLKGAEVKAPLQFVNFKE